MLVILIALSEPDGFGDRSLCCTIKHIPRVRDEEVEMPVEHVAGRNAGHVMLYALSTCGWCRKTKELLDSLGIEYDYLYVDRAQGGEKESAMRAASACSASPSFPTIVLDGGKCIIGYREAEIREALAK